MPGGFKRLREVHEAFYALFDMGAAKPQVDLGEGRTAAVRFYNRGGGSDAQDAPVSYPVLSIQDFPPEIDAKRKVGVPTAYGGDYQLDGDQKLVGREVPFALPLNFRYQVSAAAKKNTDLLLIQEWFMRSFDTAGPQPSLLLDQTPTDFGPLGEPTPYMLRVRTVPREDKVFEQVYDFTLMTWVNVRLPSALLATFDGELDLNVVLRHLQAG